MRTQWRTPRATRQRLCLVQWMVIQRAANYRALGFPEADRLRLGLRRSLANGFQPRRRESRTWNALPASHSLVEGTRQEERRFADRPRGRRSARLPKHLLRSLGDQHQGRKKSFHASSNSTRRASISAWSRRSSWAAKPVEEDSSTGSSQNFARALSFWTWMWGGSKPSLLKKKNR